MDYFINNKTKSPKSFGKRKCIAVIAPSPPPYGGMANQARLLTYYLSQSDVEVKHVPTNRMPSIMEKLFGKILGLRTIIKAMFFLLYLIKAAIKSDIFHILACSYTYFYINVIPAVLIGKIFCKRVIINYRGGEAVVFFKGFAGKMLNIFLLADETIVPSGYLKEVFSSFCVTTKIVPNIAEINRFHFSLPHFKGKKRFVCTRNFESYYDVATTIKSFSIVKEVLPDATLTLIGDGSLKIALLNLVKELGLKESVVFTGMVNPADMPTYLVEQDFFVNSSVVDNYPISILEAFACGLPVVTTSSGGIPFLVNSGENGIMVEPGDYVSLANEMIRLAENESLCVRLAKEGKKTADSHSWKHIWPLLKSAYGL